MNLDAIGLICEDINRTIEFYKNFELEFSEIGDGHFEAITESGTKLMLDSLALVLKINPNYKKATGSKIVLCFKQSSASEVDRLFEKLRPYRTVKEPWDAFWGQRYASVLDPDGNQIDIFSEL